MSKNKPLPFNIDRWFSSPEVRALSLEARCIWFEICLSMWVNADDPGHLTLNGMPIIHINPIDRSMRIKTIIDMYGWDRLHDILSLQTPENDAILQSFSSLYIQTEYKIDTKAIQNGIQKRYKMVYKSDTKWYTKAIQNEMNLLTYILNKTSCTAEKFLSLISELIYFNVFEVREDGAIYSRYLSQIIKKQSVRRDAVNKRWDKEKNFVSLLYEKSEPEKVYKNEEDKDSKILRKVRNGLNDSFSDDMAENPVLFNIVNTLKGDLQYLLIQYNTEYSNGKAANEFFLRNISAIQNFASHTFESFMALGKSVTDGVEQSDFELWKEFVSVCIKPEHKFSDQLLGVQRFLFPRDFKTLLLQGFTPDVWVPVLEKVCALGLQPHQSLYHRLKDVMRFTVGNNQQKSPSNSAKISENKSFENNGFK